MQKEQPKNIIPDATEKKIIKTKKEQPKNIMLDAPEKIIKIKELTKELKCALGLIISESIKKAI